MRYQDCLHCTCWPRGFSPSSSDPFSSPLPWRNWIPIPISLSIEAKGSAFILSWLVDVSASKSITSRSLTDPSWKTLKSQSLASQSITNFDRLRLRVLSPTSANPGLISNCLMPMVIKGYDYIWIEKKILTSGDGAHNLTTDSMPLDAKRQALGWGCRQLTMDSSAAKTLRILVLRRSQQ